MISERLSKREPSWLTLDTIRKVMYDNAANAANAARVYHLD